MCPYTCIPRNTWARAHTLHIYTERKMIEVTGVHLGGPWIHCDWCPRKRRSGYTHVGKAAVCQPSRVVPGETDAADTWIMEFQPPEWSDSGLLWVKPPILWLFVRASDITVLCRCNETSEGSNLQGGKLGLVHSCGDSSLMSRLSLVWAFGEGAQ